MTDSKAEKDCTCEGKPHRASCPVGLRLRLGIHDQPASERVCAGCGHVVNLGDDGRCIAVITYDEADRPGRCGHKCQRQPVSENEPTELTDEQFDNAASRFSDKFSGRAPNSGCGAESIFEPRDADCRESNSEGEPRHEFVLDGPPNSTLCSYVLNTNGELCGRPRDADCHVPPSREYDESMRRRGLPDKPHQFIPQAAAPPEPTAAPDEHDVHEQPTINEIVHAYVEPEPTVSEPQIECQVE